MKFKKFRRHYFLEGSGQPWLDCFFARFEPELEVRSIALPRPSADDDSYFAELTRRGMAPEAVIDALMEGRDEGESRKQKAERGF